MNIGFLILWLLASLGGAKLFALAENLIHGLGWQRSSLQKFRTVHNACLVGYPVLLLAVLGWSGPQLLWNSDWSRVTVAGWMLLALGGVGLVALAASTVRHWSYRPPRCEVESRSTSLNLAADSSETLIGDGRARWLAKLPYNEQFSLEVHERTYVLPRLPAAWDGLSIVHFSDLHFRGPVTRRYFELVMDQAQQLQGDIIFFTGDLLDQKSSLEWLPSTLGRLSAPLGRYFVLGNHDWYVGIEPQIRSSLFELGWVDVAGRVHELTRGTERLVLCGNERPWLGSLPDLSEVPSETFRILLSHGPDQITWAREQPIDLMLAGHTHGGQIRLPILGPFYSPSLYGCRYASGVFQVGPTLMSVTRGISGREPIRYNCKPELTKLTLRRE